MKKVEKTAVANKVFAKFDRFLYMCNEIEQLSSYRSIKPEEHRYAMKIIKDITNNLDELKKKYLEVKK